MTSTTRALELAAELERCVAEARNVPWDMRTGVAAELRRLAGEVERMRAVVEAADMFEITYDGVSIGIRDALFAAVDAYRRSKP